MVRIHSEVRRSRSTRVARLVKAEVNVGGQRLEFSCIDTSGRPFGGSYPLAGVVVKLDPSIEHTSVIFDTYEDRASVTTICVKTGRAYDEWMAALQRKPTVQDVLPKVLE